MNVDWLTISFIVGIIADAALVGASWGSITARLKNIEKQQNGYGKDGLRPECERKFSKLETRQDVMFNLHQRELARGGKDEKE